MGCIEIIEDGKTYDPELDVWVDTSGRIFIKNKFDPSDIVFICISGERWTYRRSADDVANWAVLEATIDWSELSLPKGFETALKHAVKKKLKTVSHTYLRKCHLMLSEFGSFLKPEWNSFSDLRMPDIDMFWNGMTAAYRPFFRALYYVLANQNIDGASHVIATRLKGMKARTNTKVLKDVLNWHPTKGALTRQEERLLRNAIETRSPDNERTNQLGMRLFCWLLIATLKRPKQIKLMRINCLKVIETNGVKEHFVLIKPVKAQTGDPERWWSIPEALYEEMERYSAIPWVARCQKHHKQFWVFDSNPLSYYVKHTLKLESPRTGKPLHVTAVRIRHTGATRLAFSGVPRDIIAEILEHDDPGSCQSYIDAMGSELCPALERADRNMGSLFKHLAHAYFNGKVVDELNDQPVVLPDFSQPSPLFVGSCGRDTCSEGRCTKHPFVECYNGCPNFLAWREADHHRALAYADKELDRWRKASGHTEQASTAKEYEELRENILIVIDRIEKDKEKSQ